jgi:microcompartment protein CcmL/EutN
MGADIHASIGGVVDACDGRLVKIRAWGNEEHERHRIHQTASIARGIEATDQMLKSAGRVLASHPICAGKYHPRRRRHRRRQHGRRGRVRVSGHFLVDKLILSNVHPDVYPAVSGAAECPAVDALGVIETFVCASCIVAADIVAKAAQSKLLYIRLGLGLGGKAYFTFGDVGSVEASINRQHHFSDDSGVIATCITAARGWGNSSSERRGGAGMGNRGAGGAVRRSSNHHGLRDQHLISQFPSSAGRDEARLPSRSEGAQIRRRSKQYQVEAALPPRSPT